MIKSKKKKQFFLVFLISNILNFGCNYFEQYMRKNRITSLYPSLDYIVKYITSFFNGSTFEKEATF